MARTRPSSLLIRLLVAYLGPTLALLLVFGWLVHREAKRGLEESLGRRLIGVAQAATTQVRPEAVLFLASGDDASRTARRLRHKLDLLRRRTDASRILILDRELRSRADTRGELRIGDRYYHAEADRPELERVFSNAPASSVLFKGADGRMYKTGYAPVVQQGKVVAAVAVEGSARFFSALARLRTYLLASGSVVAALVVGITLLLSGRITRPLRLLTREARRIGAGNLDRPIPVTSNDEVGLLAATMNEMREGLHARDQQMQMMLSGIAHEVRNPLGGIELFSGLLRDDLREQGLPEAKDKLDKLDRIDRELYYLKRVVEDFLDYARRRQPELSAQPLAHLVHETVELLRPDAGARGVGLVACCDGQPEACCDGQQIRRVLLNLARNAIQASERGRQVTVACRTDGDQAVLEVRDQGSGIAPGDLEQIFAPFFTRREKGSGLGLALAKKIVEQHGGRIAVQSTLDQGSTFSVRLPLSAPQQDLTKGGD